MRRVDGVMAMAAIAMGLSVTLLCRWLRAETNVECIARANAVHDACSSRAQKTETDVPEVLRGRACDDALNVSLAACAAADSERRRAAIAAKTSAQQRVQFAVKLMHDLKDWSQQLSNSGFDDVSATELDAATEDVRKRFAQLRAAMIEAREALGDFPDVNVSPALTPELRSAIENAPGEVDEYASKLAALVAKMVTNERACRADKKCVDARAAKKAEAAFFAAVVSPMCAADKAREMAAADMAHERANPSGYVDKKKLYDDGAIIQQSKEQLAAMASEYSKVRRHAWRGWKTECQEP